MTARERREAARRQAHLAAAAIILSLLERPTDDDLDPMVEEELQDIRQFHLRAADQIEHPPSRGGNRDRRDRR
jgi:hypothetical protein